MAAKLFTTILILFTITAYASDQVTLNARLFEAAGKEDTEAVLEALKEGADINALSEGGLQTPLMQSVLFGRESMVKIFLEKGADV